MYPFHETDVLIGRHRIKWPGSRLPGELTDEIIAWVAHSPLTEWPYEPHPYYRTLLSCCVVCSQWLPASRHQLFRNICIRRSENYDLFVSRVLSQHSMGVYLSHIGILQLANYPYNSSGPSAIPFAYAFVRHLPNLTSLHVKEGGLMTYLCRQLRTPLALSRFPSIQELSIDLNAFPSFGDIRRTLTSLPNLTVLSMHTRVSWPEPSTELAPLLTHGASPSSRPRLMVLSYTWIEDHSSGDQQRALQLLTWLASTSTGSSLRRLTLVLYWSDNAYGDMCGPAFVHTVARCVEELTLHIESENGQSLR